MLLFPHHFITDLISRCMQWLVFFVYGHGRSEPPLLSLACFLQILIYLKYFCIAYSWLFGSCCGFFLTGWSFLQAPDKYQYSSRFWISKAISITYDINCCKVYLTCFWWLCCYSHHRCISWRITAGRPCKVLRLLEQLFYWYCSVNDSLFKCCRYLVATCSGMLQFLVL